MELIWPGLGLERGFLDAGQDKRGKVLFNICGSLERSRIPGKESRFQNVLHTSPLLRWSWVSHFSFSLPPRLLLCSLSGQTGPLEVDVGVFA